MLIHDGARPLVSADIIKRSMQAVKEYRACVAGMPVKDTIKIADEDGYAKLTARAFKSMADSDTTELFLSTCI